MSLFCEDDTCSGVENTLNVNINDNELNIQYTQKHFMLGEAHAVKSNSPDILKPGSPDCLGKNCDNQNKFFTSESNSCTSNSDLNDNYCKKPDELDRLGKGCGHEYMSSLKRINFDDNLSLDESASKRLKLNEGDDVTDECIQNNIPVSLSDKSYNLSLNTGNEINKQAYNSLEFDVLDEVNEGIGDASADDLSDSDISEDEIDALLDEGLTRLPRKDEIDELAHEERKKVLLKIRGHNHFDVLPEGWIEVTHNSGMPVYLHKQSRVCTMSKPYFLGSGSARKHEVPISAIPCLHYKKELEKEEKEKDNKNLPDFNKLETPQLKSNSSVGASLPLAKVESVQENHREHSLDFMAVREYCQKLFDFQTITVRRFRTWAGRRKHQKIMKEQQRPSLPDGTKLITCPLPPTPEKAKTGSGNVNIKREFIMNPSGKSFVCILHEYVQHAMRMQPKYIFKELENASTPYGAIVVINKMEYGSGYGSSKKQAKSEAARATLEILIPQLKEVNSDGKATQEQPMP